MSQVSDIVDNFIGGEFVPFKGNMIAVLNPASGQRIAAAPDAEASIVDGAVDAARRAQVAWSRLPAIERAGWLRKISQAVRANGAELAQLVSLEQGKVKPLAELEVYLAAEYIDYMAEWARRIEGEIVTSDRPGEDIFIYRRPLGVVAGILPWNFPLFMIARKMAPALVTGNTVVIKPSEETPLCAAAFARIVAEVDLPAGVFNMVHGGGATTGAALSGHTGIDMVSFTGSTVAGAKIYQQAARNITKVSLELGGKAPVIVMDDANLELAVGTLRASKTINSGQACHCPERVYVHRKVVDQFTEMLAGQIGAISYGDPLGDSPVEMGPLINAAAVAKIDGLVRDARQKGATLVTGGAIAGDCTGFHYQPTVVAGVSEKMEIMRQEVFGPVLMVSAIDSLEEGIALANDTEYGLSSSIFTNSLAAAKQAIRELRFGETYVNRENFEAIQGFHAGVKKSGIGGADGKHGLYEFMATQVVYS